MKKIKVLVIDDEMTIANTFVGVQFILKKEGVINIEYEVANTQADLKDILKRDFVYDIVFIDYKLNGDFLDEKKDGIGVIEVLRERNQLCKVVFFSSFFTETSATDLTTRDFFKLINEFKIDKIISKDMINIINSIKELSKGLNLVSVTLRKMIENYEKIGESFYYTTDDGKRVSGRDLIEELEKNSTIGREFEERYFTAVHNMILDCDFGGE